MSLDLKADEKPLLILFAMHVVLSASLKIVVFRMKKEASVRIKINDDILFNPRMVRLLTVIKFVTIRL